MDLRDLVKEFEQHLNDVDYQWELFRKLLEILNSDEYLHYVTVLAVNNVKPITLLRNRAVELYGLARINNNERLIMIVPALYEKLIILLNGPLSIYIATLRTEHGTVATSLLSSYTLTDNLDKVINHYKELCTLLQLDPKILNLAIINMLYVSNRTVL